MKKFVDYDHPLRAILARHGFDEAAMRIDTREVRDHAAAAASWTHYPECMSRYPQQLSGHALRDLELREARQAEARRLRSDSLY